MTNNDKHETLFSRQIYRQPPSPAFLFDLHIYPASLITVTVTVGCERHNQGHMLIHTIDIFFFNNLFRFNNY